MTDLLEEDGCLAKDALSLLHFALAPDERLPRGVHLVETALMLLEFDVEFIDRLRATRPDGDEGRRRLKRRNRDRRRCEGRDLGRERAKPSVHLVQTADVTNKGTLEGVDLGVKLMRTNR